MATLYEKLIAADLPIESATEDGAVSGLPGVAMTAEQIQTMSDIVLEHLRPLEYAKVIRMRARYESALPAVRNIPDWSIWDWSTAKTWEDEHIGNPLISARSVVPSMPFTAGGMRGGFTTLLDILDNMWILQQRLTQMEIALRDEVWRGAASEE